MTREQILIIHKDLLKDLCMEIHNCIDCLNETTKKIYCNPYIETFYLSDVRADFEALKSGKKSLEDLAAHFWNGKKDMWYLGMDVEYQGW